MKTVFSKQGKLVKIQTITSILLFCLLSNAKLSGAFPYLSEHNLREACRREVAGSLLNLHHLQAAAEKNKLSYSKKISELTARIKADTLEISKVEKQAKSEHYLAQPEAKMNEVKSRIHSAIRSKEELQTLLVNSVNLQESTKSELNKLKTSLKEIFIFDVPNKSKESKQNAIKPSEDPGYLKYVHPCPEGRSSCPLDLEHKKILRSALKQELQAGCKAYSE